LVIITISIKPTASKTIPDPQQLFILYSDDSDTRVEAVLSQTDGQERDMQYVTAKLATSTE
jgi:hypothetical protein